MATRNAPTTIRLADDDKKLIEELKQRLGVRSTTELIRVAIRLLDRTSLANSRADSSAAHHPSGAAGHQDGTE